MITAAPRGHLPRLATALLAAAALSACGSGGHGTTALPVPPTTAPPSPSPAVAGSAAATSDAPGTSAVVRSTSPPASASASPPVTASAARPPAGHSAPPASADPAGTSATKVIADYADAITARDYPRVWALGGQHLNSSYDEMVAGYRDTASDRVFPFSSRAGMVQVYLLSTSRSGRSTVFQALYTVRAGTIVAATARQLADGSANDTRVLAGDWAGHGRGLFVTSDGIAVETGRRYDTCLPGSPTGTCDDVDGRRRRDRGRLRGRAPPRPGERRQRRRGGGGQLRRLARR